MWCYATDSLNITPAPDFLVLADECYDYHYEMRSQENSDSKVCHVLNPGNFSHDQSFTVIYPHSGIVQPSKVDF
jgi:hypothetical protein